MTTHPHHPMSGGFPTRSAYERPAGLQELVDSYRAIPRVKTHREPRPGTSEPIRPEGCGPLPESPFESDAGTPPVPLAAPPGPPYCPVPGCGGDSKVIDSRHRSSERCIYRRRKCLKCGRRFSTRETHYSAQESGPGGDAIARVVRQLGRVARVLNRQAERLGGVAEGARGDDYRSKEV